VARACAAQGGQIIRPVPRNPSPRRPLPPCQAIVHATIRAALAGSLAIVVPAGLLPLMAEEGVFLSGAHLSYTELFSGSVKADGKSGSWDDGRRIELHLRDYYFDQRTYHPFAELGVFYEQHDASLDHLKLDTETIGLQGVIGAAIPLWSSADGGMATGFGPEVGLHIGTFSIDADSDGLRSDDDSFRYGASAGISGWFAYRRSVAVGLGLIGSYWRATSVDIQTTDGVTVEEHHTSPTGWDLGLRLSLGFMF
jgi:hypothetical protein